MLPTMQRLRATFRPLTSFSLQATSDHSATVLPGRFPETYSDTPPQAASETHSTSPSIYNTTTFAYNHNTYQDSPALPSPSSCPSTLGAPPPYSELPPNYLTETSNRDRPQTTTVSMQVGSFTVNGVRNDYTVSNKRNVTINGVKHTISASNCSDVCINGVKHDVGLENCGSVTINGTSHYVTMNNCHGIRVNGTSSTLVMRDCTVVGVNGVGHALKGSWTWA